MSSIASELLRIQNAKLALKTSIINKGVEVPEGTLLDGYSELVDQISSSGPTPEPVEWLPNPQGYLRFKFITDGQVIWQNKKGDIQYSKNGGASWTAFNGAAVSMSAGDEIWFKGDLTSGVGASSESSASKFYTSGKFYVSGNVQSLCSFNNTLLDYHFAWLFRKCVGLNVDVNTPLVLPATTLAQFCYQNMFQYCSSLTTAPELPATTLATNCYSYMFSGCSLLTTAPELPATTLATYCYNYMFSSCYSLTTAPELPATTLATNCYYCMFNSCYSLTTAPELPATTLATNCYSYMFYGCSSLTTAPELPATTLATGCYNYMFYDCRSLNYIKALFTTAPSPSYTYNWVSGVASTGTFVKNANATWTTTGTNAVPTGWTVYTESTDPRSPLSGQFSVSSTKKVKFAKGNLQAVIGGGPTDTYNYSASSWKFAGHQYDIIGNATGNTSFATGTTVDLFGWVGASASYDSYGLCTSIEYNSTYYGTSASDALKTDWGSIPGVVSSYGSGWYTLTSDEWNYLFTERANASSLYGQCQISTANGTVTGMLILPDNWVKPSNCTVTPGDGDFSRVTYSASAASGASNAWVDMEAAGAVFLPAAGFRRGVSVREVGSEGHYWSSSVVDEAEAYIFLFMSEYGGLYNDFRRDGLSVRLVRDAN